MKFLAFILLPTLSFGQIVMNNQVECVVPSISAGPTSQTQVTNTSLTITVTAAGTAPLAYQWTLGSSPVNGATTSSYSTNSATAATNSYYVIVTNTCGSITSSAAVLAWTNGAGTVGLTPTNVAGCVGYWVVDDYYTNGTHPTMDSRVAGYGPFTNTSANAASMRDGPSLNGHKTGLWSYSIPTSMKSSNSLPAGTKAIWAVFCITNAAATMDFVSDKDATLKVSPCRNSGGVPTTRMIDGSTVYFEATVTNKWIDEMYILDGASAATYTNGVLAASGNTGTLNAWTSIYMGSWEGILAEFAFFTNHVSSGDITSLHTSATNRYGYNP